MNHNYETARIVFLLVISLELTGAFTDDEWIAFKKRFSKHYSNEEDTSRKEAYIKTDNFIKQHQQSQSTYTLSHNKLSDMQREPEILSRFSLPSSKKLNESSPAVGDPPVWIPYYLDYRLDTCMGPIKDHNPDKCKSDWAFAAIDVVEYKKCKQVGYPISLSVQQLIDCDPNSRGCLGGNAVYAWAYLMNAGGSSQEIHYPYGYGDAYVCGFHGQSVGTKILGFAYAGHNLKFAAERALLRYGPLATEIDAPLSFFYYSGGLYDDAECGSGGNLVAITIVGYGTTNEGVPFWIVRGSFGVWWGDEGYMYVRRGINLCNIEFLAAYVIVT